MKADWLEAFDGHPKIGDAQALQGGAETTAMQEQGQVSMALASTREALSALESTIFGPIRVYFHYLRVRTVSRGDARRLRAESGAVSRRRIT